MPSSASAPAPRPARPTASPAAATVPAVCAGATGPTPYLLHVAPLGLPCRGLPAVGKRALDIVGAAALLTVALPIFVAVGVAVRLESRGPALFAQRRVGQHGRPFRMLKFRSMRVDAEAALRADPDLYAAYLANDFKLPAAVDPRLTRLGRALRRTSLDELPQLVNVLRGDMSLVGPRPVVEPEVERYGEDADIVLSVRPGMTGLWQVSGRSAVGMADRRRLDVDYVTGWSLWRDVVILARTLPAVLRQRGAH